MVVLGRGLFFMGEVPLYAFPSRFACAAVSGVGLTIYGLVFRV